MIDFLGVLNIKQAPRFSDKISYDNIIYYDTPFYDVIRCNVDKDNESYNIIKNSNYSHDEIISYCENKH